MAVNEVIRSPFPTQPSARSAKLRIYESLFLFNQGVDHLVALVRNMEKFSFADQEELQSFEAEIEEVRCDMNADFAEHLVDSERFDEARFSKQRHDYEKQWRDPDDVYLNVERREEERKKQGLPPRVGIVPHSAVAAEEQRWEAEQEHKKKRAGKPAPKAKNSAREKRHE
ncbi:MAG TPA: hypothetical protein VMT53_26800 [Terriglobales bacterium]|nr:hypothetical protein [Terriglobales bacterium]HXJ94600.1 hypothetical protein [Terriglobia bacterium]